MLVWPSVSTVCEAYSVIEVTGTLLYQTVGIVSTDTVSMLTIASKSKMTSDPSQYKFFMCYVANKTPMFLCLKICVLCVDNSTSVSCVYFVILWILPFVHKGACGPHPTATLGWQIHSPKGSVSSWFLSLAWSLLVLLCSLTVSHPCSFQLQTSHHTHLHRACPPNDITGVSCKARVPPVMKLTHFWR